MDEPFLMSILKSPGKLDRNVQDPLQRLLRPTFIELSVVNPVLEAAAFNVFSKDARRG